MKFTEYMALNESPQTELNESKKSFKTLMDFCQYNSGETFKYNGSWISLKTTANPSGWFNMHSGETITISDKNWTIKNNKTGEIIYCGEFAEKLSASIIKSLEDVEG